MWLHSLKVAQLLRSAACLHTNQSRSYLNHLVHRQVSLYQVLHHSQPPKTQLFLSEMKLYVPSLASIPKCRFSSTARVITRCCFHRTGQSEPAWRCVHQRTPSAEPHPPQDRGDGCSRSPTLRHLATTASITRLCVQDTKPLPGDWQHSARGYRG